MPKDGKRAIVRCRDDDYLHPFPPLNLAGARALHLDGHMSDAAIHYAKACREQGILTSLDGGGVREGTMELLPLIDVAVISERFAEQLGMSNAEALELLRTKGCRVGGVTRGEHGLLWYEGKEPLKEMAALPVAKEHIIDTNGAGDVFHGAYIYSYLTEPDAPWETHFDFGRSASAHAIQHLGNEAKLPTRVQVEQVMKAHAA
jgi:sugar/nucleoside kinase (ribokinase family)